MFKQQPINRLVLVLGLAFAAVLAAVTTVVMLTVNKESHTSASKSSAQSSPPCFYLKLCKELLIRYKFVENKFQTLNWLSC
jgi:hypothetical protein